jgi:hypothetical protein
MPTRAEVADQLAQTHYAVEPGISHIFRVVIAGSGEDAPDEPIKLLEVNEDTLPYGVRPVYFRPHPSSGIVYPSAIIEITPAEFERLTRGDADIRLPDGWNIDRLIPRVPVPEAARP